MSRLSVAISLFCLQAAFLLASSETTDDKLCTRDGSYRRSYPGNCDMYVECVHRRATVESCGWFHRFDEAKRGCKLVLFPFVSECKTADDSPTEKPKVVPTKAAVSLVSLADEQICTQQNSYKTYYPGDCDKYYQCDNGKPTEESCGWFHRFDEKSGECKFHWLFIGSVDCTKALSPTKQPPTTATTKPTGSSKTTQKSSTDGGSTSPNPTKATTAPPNGSTTKKHNGAGSVEISMILATLCTFATIFRHLH